ncbi:MAG TPA: cation transporter [Gemmatimonadaceae bacterium]|jgi:copper chaperone CopZ|nr:cation transporter [Gemmatimonadaceae bacterium]
MERTTLKIGGMSCMHCVGRVNKTLQQLGVQVEQVKIGEATVDFDPAVVSAERIAQALADEGYPVVSSAR